MPKKIEHWDVIVVGAGNAAHAAAVSAYESGAARVLMLEKAPENLRGGNTHYSGGLLRVAFDAPEALLELVPEVQTEVPDFLAGVAPYPAEAFWADLHRVTRGENLAVIARRYGTTVSAIQAANELGRRTLINIGQQLRIPTVATNQ